VVRNLDAIVWTVNPENDSLDKLVEYIHEYAPAFLEPAGIRCWFHLPQHVPAWPLPSDFRHHLFSFVKECLTNIVKHSRCSAVTFHLSLEGSQLRLSIEDDGQGFSPEEVASSGNGLKNMRKRIANC
jgi:two-component system, NarL family, sensor kinase